VGFVKTPSEIQAIEARLKNPQFLNARVVQVQFESDPNFIRAVLPPPLGPTDSPMIFARIGRWQSNCVGNFGGAGIYLSARHGDTIGVYVLAMYMDSDSAVIFGRETFGEPKKMATVHFEQDPGTVAGSIVRHGVELIGIDATPGKDQGTGQGISWAFNVKSWTAANGVGLEGDALLTATQFDTVLTKNISCDGSLRLNSTIHDPLGDVPITRIHQVRYYEGDHSTASKVVARIPSDTFLPYAYGRNDDWSASF
jgi:acetoacetate decarboxylase